MSRLSAQTQLYIGIGLLVVVTIAVTFLFILPVYQKAADLEAQIRTEEENLSTAQALLARRQSAKAQSAANEVELMRVANQVPDSPQLPSVIIEIQDLANNADLSLESIAPDDMIEAVDGQGVPAGYYEVPMTLLVRGDWEDMISFMRNLAGLERGVRIVSSTLTYVPEEEDGAGDYIDATISIEVYVMAGAATDKRPSTETMPASTTTTATVSP